MYKPRKREDRKENRKSSKTHYTTVMCQRREEVKKKEKRREGEDVILHFLPKSSYSSIHPLVAGGARESIVQEPSGL